MDNDQLKELYSEEPFVRSREQSGYANKISEARENRKQGAIRAAQAEAEKMQLTGLPQGLGSSMIEWEAMARTMERQCFRLSQELAAETTARKHFQRAHDERAGCYPAGTIIIEPGDVIPPELMRVDDYVELKRKYDRQNDRADRWHDTYQMMEADLGKVRAAIGDHAFDRIVDK